MTDDTMAQAQERAQAFLAKPHRLLIDGAWVEARTGETFEVFDPSVGTVIAHAARALAADVDHAVVAARRAFDTGPWSRMSARERGQLMLRLAAKIREHAEELAVIEAMDNGKPYRLALPENVLNAADRFEYFAGWATTMRGETIETWHKADNHAFTLREPVGVAGLIIPWNVPLPNACGKLAPAMAAGCTMVLKPAEQTPLSALRLAELIQDVGFPPGVVNVVTGFGAEAGGALVEHPGVDKISFTGSTATGKAIIRAATETLKRVTVELGGKSPTIVFPDADIEQAIAGTAFGVFGNSGQVCTAGTRLFAHRRVFDQLVEGVAERARALRVGPAMAPDSDLGPLISSQQRDRVMSYIEAGRKDGASVLTGGNAPALPGYFVEPTIFTDTRPDMSIRREEIFGPVLCAMPYDDDDLDLLAAQANDTIYGLSARIFTRDISTALKMARKVRAGSIRVNGALIDMNVPFGGYKQSGWGREGGHEAVENFTEIKAVTIRL